jgi:large repetitive protein
MHCKHIAILIILGVSISTHASAAVSKICPSLTARVVQGSKVDINVSRCDGPFDGGMSGPIAPYARSGKVSIGANSEGRQMVTYTHKGDAASSDVFYLEDNDGGIVAVKVSITPAKKSKR